MSVVSFTRRVRAFLLDLPMRGKVMGIALSMAAVLGVGLFLQIHRPYQRLEVDEVDRHAQFIAEVVAEVTAPVLRAGARAELQRLLVEIAKITPGIGSTVNRIEVRDEAGHVLASATGSPPAPKDRLLQKTAPFAGGPPGSVLVALNDNHVDFELAWHTRRIIAATAIIGLLGLAATWWLMHWVTRPICELVQTVRGVKVGNFRARAPVRGHDEVGELANAFNDMLGALEHKEAINRQLLRKLMAAEEEERKRVARELHDHTGQALTSLIASLAALRNGEHSKELNALLALAMQTLSEVHDLSRTLRPRVLDDLGLVPALQKMCDGMAKQLGRTVYFSAIGFGGSYRLPHEIEVALYRIGQEALANAIHHGQAHSVDMMVHRKSGSVLAVIEDDGRGFDASDWRELCLGGDHLGLLGIEERAALLGGTLRVESRPGAGTSLFVDIPLSDHRDA